MAEVSSYNVAELAAGRRMAPAYEGQERARVWRTPTTYAALSVDDTIKTGIVIKAGSRILPPFISFGTGAASSTMNLGIRKVSDGSVVDATALASLHAITTAGANFSTNGTKVAGGVDYIVPEDMEVYATMKGATSSANQQIVVYVRTLEA